MTLGPTAAANVAQAVPTIKLGSTTSNPVEIVARAANVAVVGPKAAPFSIIYQHIMSSSS